MLEKLDANKIEDLAIVIGIRGKSIAFTNLSKLEHESDLKY